MALSFTSLLRRLLEVEFRFAVDPNFMHLEEKMARHYGLKVVAGDTLLTWLSHHPALFPLMPVVSKKQRMMASSQRRRQRNNWRRIHAAYQEVIRDVDAVVNLNGIAFIGDGTRSWISSLTERTCSIYARKHQKPFFRFVQSYGPFTDWRVRRLAKLEFSRLPCVMARGETSAAHCREITGTSVYAYPDIAVTLPCADSNWLNRYLKGLGLVSGKYIVLSPSAVIARMPSSKTSATGEGHVALFAGIAKHFLSRGRDILFVPHATFPEPFQCDRAVSKRCLQLLIKDDRSAAARCRIVEDELDAMQLKSLISSARLAVVSRYHALVAALSTGVPAVTIGWNDKYLDIMAYYHCQDHVVDARRGSPGSVLNAVIHRCGLWSLNQQNELKSRQPLVEDKVHRAVQLCADWIKTHA